MSLKMRNNAKKFKDDDYETTKETLELLLPYIKNFNKIYDPFFCCGRVKKNWEELNKICYNEKLDAFDREPPEDFDIIISNIPFSIKEKSMKLFFDLKKPFIILMPLSAIGSKWINKYFNKLQFIIPHKRLHFMKNGKMGVGSWFETCFFCYGLNLDKDIIKL